MAQQTVATVALKRQEKIIYNSDKEIASSWVKALAAFQQGEKSHSCEQLRALLQLKFLSPLWKEKISSFEQRKCYGL